MSHVIDLGHADGTDVEVVGGKAANLSRLILGGFDVPPGFAVTTHAYAQFADQIGLAKVLDSTAFDYDSAERLEEQSEQIRSHITASGLPDDIDAAIRKHYEQIGDDRYVAVRSSGTAEDMASASFAGLHDTYLDVRGADAVTDAVRRCWASMWTARAIAYRHQQGIDHHSARIAVVVQEMVESEISGVMFTANPLNSRTDEIVINSSWGLGEGIVSGITTPDEYIVDIDRLTVRDSSLGAKEAEVVRNPETGIGTVTRPVSPQQQAVHTLDDDQVAQLAGVGRKVMEYYGGLPQDTEWAYAGGRFQLLQARPVTGADFTWEEDLEEWQVVAEEPDTIWTVKWASEFWTGAITPLFYTLRGREFQNLMRRFNTLCGLDELNEFRYFKHRRGTAYYNVNVDKVFYNNLLPRSMRAGSLGYLPESWVPEVLEQPLDVPRLLRLLVRVSLLTPHKRPDRWHAHLRAAYLDSRVDDANGPTPEELRRFSDLEVRRQLQRSVDLAEDFMDQLWSGLFVATQWAMGLLGQILAKWYTGGNAFVFADLLSGLGRPTLMSIETHDLWKLADRIRNSESLSKTFRENEGAAFFEAVEASPDDQDFVDAYRQFIVDHGHRGHADRDIYYPRRAEDPSLDYEAFRAVLSAENPAPPWEAEERIAARRQETEDAVIENLRRQTFGSLKVEAFKVVYNHVIDFLVLRDDWRHYVDRVSLAKKRCVLELADRAVVRGLLDDRDDVYFLGEREFLTLLDTGRRTALLDAKIAGRRKAFLGFLSYTEPPPTYLIGSTPAELDEGPGEQDGGVLRGTGTARGNATGPANIVPELKQIGRVKAGDILICNGTDPGWAPVFPLIKGLVIETGGMLAHGSCLSREYGIPAVQLRNAMQLIEQGATITIDGATGEIRVDEA